jgi:hypothetical protein
MSKRIVFALTFCSLVAFFARGTRGQSLAGPWPFDEPLPAGITRGLNLLPTLPLLPGQLDPNSIGVTDAELVMSGSTSASGSPYSQQPSHDDCSHDRWCPHNGPCSHFNRILVVDDDRVQCPTAGFTTVQSAVNAALPGDKIKVCPGTYTEQVTLSLAKHNIMLYSSSPWQAAIHAPAFMADPKAIVYVNGATNITIRDFAITGPGGMPIGCDSLRWGVRVDHAGSAVIVGNHIADIRDNPFSGCQNGVGVLVGRDAEGELASAVVAHNVIDAYQKGGVVVDGVTTGMSSSWADVGFNLVNGAGPTSTIAQNGIQVSRNAVGNIHHNRVTNNNYVPPTNVSEGILMFGERPNATVIRKNASGLNDDGIDLFDSQGTEASFNWLVQNDYDGMYAGPSSANNKIQYNLAEENVEHDCHDDSVGTRTAGTANFWFKNIGATENRPGLCKHKGW